MKIREYGFAKCVGEENLAQAVQDRAKEGYRLTQVVFTGVVQVVPKSGILDPGGPPPTLTSYLAVFEIEYEMKGSDA